MISEDFIFMYLMFNAVFFFLALAGVLPLYSYLCRDVTVLHNAPVSFLEMPDSNHVEVTPLLLGDFTVLQKAPTLHSSPVSCWEMTDSNQRPALKKCTV